MARTAAEKARALQEITEIDIKLVKLNSVKNKVNKVKRKIREKKSDWKESYNKLSGNAQLKAVRKKDVFEGEMAESLGKRVQELDADIIQEMAQAEEVALKLVLQEGYIDKKIVQLQQEKAAWQAWL